MTIVRRLQSLVPSRCLVALRLAFFRLRSLFFRGDAVSCPCCERTFSRFVSVGSPARRAACPGCGSRERHRLLWLYLRNETDFFTARKKILHIAPEDSFQKAFTALPNLEYVSGDLHSPSAMMRLDVTDLDLPDGSFDLILCSHVLEHVPDDRRAMRELHRVLKPGGLAIIQVPLDTRREQTYEDFSITSPTERAKAFGQSDHVRWYGLDFTQRLEGAGFHVTTVSYARGLDIERLGLSLDEEIFRCEKR